MSNLYWIGPAGVLVPSTIDEVECRDLVNFVDRYGNCTEVGGSDRQLADEEYRQKYAYQGVNGLWFYNNYSTTSSSIVLPKPYSSRLTSTQEVPSGFWLGPFDVLVSNELDRVKHADGINFIRKDGSTTEMKTRSFMTRDEYLGKYTVMGTNGKYYYLACKEDSNDEDSEEDSSDEDSEEDSSDEDSEEDSGVDDTSGIPSGYWVGPAGVLVPNGIDKVRCKDQINWHMKTGNRTDILTKFSELTDEEYLRVYATKGINNLWFYDPAKATIAVKDVSQTPRGYWIGTAGILVPDSIDKIYDLDQHNYMDRNGQVGEAVWQTDTQLTPEEYREKYAYKDIDDKWYYKNNSETTYNNPNQTLGKCVFEIPNGYWMGPAGVLIPTSIRTVVDRDQRNSITYMGGDSVGCTEMVWDSQNALSVEEYREKYAKLNLRDGKWYYRR